MRFVCRNRQSGNIAEQRQRHRGHHHATADQSTAIHQQPLSQHQQLLQRLQHPPPPPDHPPTTEQEAQIEGLRRQLAEQEHEFQQREEAWRQAFQQRQGAQQQHPEHGQGTGGHHAAPSWADTVTGLSDSTLTYSESLKAGAGPPPPQIAQAVYSWPFLHRYIVESLITTGKCSWKDVCDPHLAESLKRESLLPLERAQNERWSWLPPQPHLHKFVFTAGVSLAGAGLKWELRWPLQRQRSTTKLGEPQ